MFWACVAGVSVLWSPDDVVEFMEGSLEEVTINLIPEICAQVKHELTGWIWRKNFTDFYSKSLPLKLF